MINYGLSNIPGLVSAYDVGNTKCYSGSGSTWYDLCNPTLTSPGDPFWANNIDSITISLILEKIGTSTGYAQHPVSKWNISTGNTSFVLYHFANYQNNNQDGVINWYGSPNQGASWTNITSGYDRLTVGNKYHIVLQFRSELGGQMWVNGVKQSIRYSPGMLGQTILPTNSTTGNIEIYGPTANAVDRVHHIQFYNRELEDNEIMMLYKSHKGRFSLS